MKHKDLEVNKVYYDVIDPKIPLRFLGRIELGHTLGAPYYAAYFKPVRTQINKNWYLPSEEIKIFNPDAPNDHIKEYKPKLKTNELY